MKFENEAAFAAACEELVTATAELMTKKGAHAAAAESLTGGLISSEIVRVAGSSRWFSEGCVTYTDAAKTRRLMISPALIEAHTAVSAPVAHAMAEGMLSSSGADAAVSATGLAGPGKDEYGREAGLVFIGGAVKNGCAVKELRLSGSRLDIRRQAAYEALKLLYELAKLI